MKKTKGKRKPTKEEQDAAFNKMALALGKYVESMGGTALVIGGVSIGQNSGARKFNYFVQIGITGKKPTERNL